MNDETSPVVYMRRFNEGDTERREQLGCSWCGFVTELAELQGVYLCGLCTYAPAITATLPEANALTLRTMLYVGNAILAALEPDNMAPLVTPLVTLIRTVVADEMRRGR